ncbi:DUF4136 domain-containing protein [Pedobacter nutrimenti]|jgi:hypothetical protein|uniref:Uncharacterized protein DUF4136 n=1 Tax=Pedobacter nutrimenti TaxID=1241337 RepID=A0A318UGX6_9SPHI|nr:DUF4136 domain-containing protein [Pedobacter nutrimenti]PYF75666.1 uncharacterized protein DUF4136 [Pedobacter nutrimenti]
MKRIFFLLFTMSIVVSACSSYSYYAVSNKPLSSQHYRTYAWIPEEQSKTTSFYNNDVATDKIVEAASKELDKKGLSLDNQNPDILVRYTAVVNKEVKTYNEPMYYNPPARLSPRLAYYRGRAFYYYSYYDPFPVYVGSQARRETVKAGSIMIDLIDRKTKKVIWRGWAEGELSNPQKAVDDIPQVVTNIFKKLP